MSEIFQPQVGQLNSAVTPEAGVVDTSGVDLFSAAAETAVKTGFSVVGKSAIKQLNKDLDDIVGERADDLGSLRTSLGKISQARASSNNSINLQSKARALVAQVKADTPWVSEQADAMFSRILGAGKSGGGGGVFKQSPEEKALEKFDITVAEMQVATGMNQENAAERVRMNAQQVQLTKEFEFKAAQGKMEGDVLNTYVNQTLASTTVSFMDQVARARVDGGGSIDAPTTANMSRSIDTQAAAFRAKMLQGLQTASGDPITNPPNQAAIDAIDADINAWVTKSKTFLTDSSTTKLLASLNLESTAREQQIIHENFGAIDIANAKGGQAYVSAYLDVAGQEPGVIQDWFKSQNPELMTLLGKNTNVPTLLNKGYNKLIGVDKGVPGPVGVDGVPTLISRSVSEEEALVTSAVLLNPTTPTSLLMTVFDMSAEDIKAAQALSSMLSKSPDAAKIYFGDAYKDYLVKNESGALKVADVGIKAAQGTFNTMSFAATGNFTPPKFEIKIVTPSGGFGVPRVTAVGEGLNTDIVGVINNTYRMFKSNPTVLLNFAKNNNLPTETTPEEATQIALTGGSRGQEALPDQSIKAKAERIDKQALKDFKEQLSPEDFKELFGKEGPSASVVGINKQASAEGVDLSGFKDGEYEDENGKRVVIKGGVIVEVK